jgi:hypothetical protein
MSTSWTREREMEQGQCKFGIFEFPLSLLHFSFPRSTCRHLPWLSFQQNVNRHCTTALAQHLFYSGNIIITFIFFGHFTFITQHSLHVKNHHHHNHQITINCPLSALHTHKTNNKTKTTIVCARTVFNDTKQTGYTIWVHGCSKENFCLICWRKSLIS